MTETPPAHPVPTDDDPAELLRQVAAALRMARWRGVEAVPRAAAPAVATAPIASAAQHARPEPPTAPAKPTRELPAPPVRPPAAPPSPRASQPAPRLSQPIGQQSLLGGPQPSEIAAARALHRSETRKRLDDVFARAAACVRCPRHQGRLRTVAGTGSPTAKLFFVLGAPDEAAEKAAKPAQGPVGELLDKMLQAMGLHRDEVWLTHLCLCRGAADTPLLAEQAAQCSPWLRQQWEAIGPQVLVIFGQEPAQFLLRSQAPLGELRGAWHTVRDTPTRATWSVADLLADPAKKRQAWEDLQAVMHRVGLRR